MLICPSSVCPSVCTSVCLSVRLSRLRGGVYVRNVSVTFSSVLAWSFFGVYITYRKIWLNRSKGHFSRSVRSNFALFAIGGNLFQNCYVTFLCFGIELPRKGTNELPKDGFVWIALKVIFQGQKGRIWLLFKYVYMLFNSTELLPNFIAPCSFMSMLS